MSHDRGSMLFSERPQLIILAESMLKAVTNSFGRVVRNYITVKDDMSSGEGACSITNIISPWRRF